MRIKISLFALFIFTFLYFIGFSSCIIAGLAVGSKISNAKDMKRPVHQPVQSIFDTLSAGTWIEVFKKDGRMKDGEFIATKEMEGEDGNYHNVLILDVPGQKKHSTTPLNDIEKVVFGVGTNGPTFAGLGIGLAMDGLFWTWLAIKLNELTDGGH